MKTTLILGRDMREASEYARLVGLKPHTWQFAYNADNIRGATPERVIELPGFAKKVGRWAIESELKVTLRKSRLEREVVSADSLLALRSATVAAPESKWRGVGEQLPLFDDLGGPKQEKPTTRRAASPKRKPATAAPTTDADFFV